MKIFIIKCVVILLLSLLTCNKKKAIYEDMYGSCDTSYQTSELSFDEEQELTFRLRFVYFADSLQEEQINYDSSMMMINKFFKIANIKFELERVDTIVDSDKKENMPEYIKNNFKYYKDNKVLTCYIYGNYQPYYSEDRKYTSGAAGGIGSNFFCVRKRFVYSITMAHEISHMFSLMHTDTPSKNNIKYSIYDSDLVCDTAPINNLQEKVDGDCNFIGEDELTQEEKEQSVCNYMSWVHLKCRKCITNGQIRRIRFYIHESPMIQLAIKKGLKHEF